MSPSKKQRFSGPYRILIIIAGLAAFVWSGAHLSAADVDLRFVLIAAAAILIGPRLSVRIPHVKSEITVSDTFYFLAILIFNSPAAVLIAAAESYCSSLRYSRNREVHYFNSAQMAVSTFVTYTVIHYLFGLEGPLGHGTFSLTLLLATFVMAAVQYATNVGLVAISVALKTDQRVLLTWKQNFLFTSLAHFTAASAASIIAKLTSVFGFYAVIASTPIIAAVYFTYYVYLKSAEVKDAQIDQAQAHVKELSTHIAEQARTQEALRDSEEHYRNAFEHFRSAFDYAATGMGLIAPDGSWLQVNRSLCAIVGYTEDELLESNFQSITHPDDLGNALVNIHQLLLRQVTSTQMEQRYIHKDGRFVWLLWSASPVCDASGQVLRIIFQLQDITDRKRAEEQLMHDAFHDGLTKLPNRALFMDHLRLAIARSKRYSERMFAVLFLDLDRFKLINDSLGHLSGDQLLVEMARRLEACLRPADTVARLGGDEFTILLEDLTGVTDAMEVAERIQASLEAPFSLNGREVFTSASIGIAISATGYNQPDEVLRDADTAMYRAKVLGKARFEVFDITMHANTLTMLQIEMDLRRAIERQELFLEYQPIVSIANGDLAGFEALVRWQHPERGIVPPSQFIPVAEDSGLIVQLGQWILAEACRALRCWQKQFPQQSNLFMSVNLSGKQFAQPGLLEQIKTTLRNEELDPHNLKLEITESVVMQSVETATDTLKQLRALGVRLSIDDFGTGYSSLSYLHRFPIDTLKIDRSFVSQMTENAENAEIVRTIVTLASTLGMDVVAEGVETPEQHQRLRALGCQYAQGFLFSRPVGAEQVHAMLSEASNRQGMIGTSRTALDGGSVKESNFVM